MEQILYDICKELKAINMKLDKILPKDETPKIATRPPDHERAVRQPQEVRVQRRRGKKDANSKTKKG